MLTALLDFPEERKHSVVCWIRLKSNKENLIYYKIFDYNFFRNGPHIYFIYHVSLASKASHKVHFCFPVIAIVYELTLERVGLSDACI